MQDRNEYTMHTRRITARQHYAEANAPKPSRAGLKLVLIVACIGLAGALTAPKAKAATIGVHVASDRAATPGTYIITESGITAGVLVPGLRTADAVTYIGASRDLLDFGAVRVAVEAGASHQRGRIGGYAAVSLHVDNVRLVWSPLTRVAGVAVEF